MWPALVRAIRSPMRRAPLAPRSRTQSLSRALHASLVLIFIFSHCTLHAGAQGFLINGQFFTPGLAISDAPQPGSTQHAGSNLVIAIDVSVDGKIPQAASVPGSGMATRYDSLELYLVSSQTNVNVTVSSGPGLLTQESGSTVKHLNWPIPSCLPPGSYNLTFYEASHINQQAFFSITPVPVVVENAGNSSTSCFQNNKLQTQPQRSSPPPDNSFDRDFKPSTANTVSTIPAILFTAAPSITTTTSPEPTPATSTVTSSVAGGAAATVVVVVSVVPEVLTTAGQPSLQTVFQTVTGAIATSTITTGFLPINAAPPRVRALRIGLGPFALFAVFALLPFRWGL